MLLSLLGVMYKDGRGVPKDTSKICSSIPNFVMMGWYLLIGPVVCTTWNGNSRTIERHGYFIKNLVMVAI